MAARYDSQIIEDSRDQACKAVLVNVQNCINLLVGANDHQRLIAMQAALGEILKAAAEAVQEAN